MIHPNPQEYLIIYTKWNRLSKKKKQTTKQQTNQKKGNIEWERAKKEQMGEKEEGGGGRGEHEKEWKRKRGSGTESHCKMLHN